MMRHLQSGLNNVEIIKGGIDDPKLPVALLDGVLIVVTFRSDELGRGHPLRPVLAELDRLAWVAKIGRAHV